jgi:hypothetical protein
MCVYVLSFYLWFATIGIKIIPVLLQYLNCVTTINKDRHDDCLHLSCLFSPEREGSLVAVPLLFLDICGRTTELRAEQRPVSWTGFSSSGAHLALTTKSSDISNLPVLSSVRVMLNMLMFNMLIGTVFQGELFRKAIRAFLERRMQASAEEIHQVIDRVTVGIPGWRVSYLSKMQVQ